MNEKMEVSLAKVMPQNREAEMAVLGSMLLEENAVSRAIELIKEDSFYDSAHRKIFRGITELYGNDKAVDLVTLSEVLVKDNSLQEVGGAAYLTSLVNIVPTAANVEHYARIVKEKFILRSLITSATQIISEGYEDGQDADILLDNAERLIFEIAEHKIKKIF